MAKKKASRPAVEDQPESTAQSEGSPQPVVAENPFALASPVVDQADLDLILLVSCMATRTAEADTEANEPEAGRFEIKISRNKDNTTLVYQIGLSLVSRPKDSAAKSDPDLLIDCVFAAQYKCKDTSKLSPESIEAFGQTVVVMNVWPYWREFVHNMLPRMGLKGILLPLIKT